MALAEYGASGAILTLNTLTVDDWGDTDPALTMEDIEPSATLTRGIGGKGILNSTVTIPKRVTINIKPGGDQSRALNAMRTNRTVIQGSFTQVGTGEIATFIDGVITTKGQTGRASKTGVSDDQFILEFNDSIEI